MPLMAIHKLTALFFVAAGLSGCAVSPHLSDPQEVSDEVQPYPVHREATELVGDAEEYLANLEFENLIDEQSVLVDSLESPGSLVDGIPDISDSLAVETEARLPASEELFDYPVVVNRRVLTWVDAYTGRSRNSFSNSLQRSGRYLPMARQIFAEEGVPRDLAFLGHVESGFRFNARSPKRALGLWQFMRGTATDYGMRCDTWVDERLDPERSTRTAAIYLRWLYERYDDWLLALAGYNAGPGKVDKAIRRAGSRDFWEIAKTDHLLTETRNFVPAILAATILAKSPDAYGLPTDTHSPLEFETVSVSHTTDLGVAAQCAGVPVEEIRELNPALLKGQIPAGYEVHVPKGLGEIASSRLADVPPDKRFAFTSHQVRSGDTLGAIARRYGTSVGEIQQANGMGRSTLIGVGKVLRIPAHGSPPIGVASAVEVPASGKHKVRRGETLGAIARRYGMSTNALAKANRIADPSRIHQGQTLLIPGQPGSGSNSWQPVDAMYAEVLRKRSAPAPTAESLGRGGSTAHLVELARAEIANPESTTASRMDRVDSASAIPGQSTPVREKAHFASAGRGAEESRLTQFSDGKRPSEAATEAATGAATEAADTIVSNSAASASSTRTHSYTVRSGDTLYGIARQFGHSVSDLKRWNGIGSRGLIRPGDEIRLAPMGETTPTGMSRDDGKTHVVLKGENLWRIAKNYGVRVGDLMRWNGLPSRARIYPGQKLQIF